MIDLLILAKLLIYNSTYTTEHQSKTNSTLRRYTYTQKFKHKLTSISNYYIVLLWNQSCPSHPHCLFGLLSLSSSLSLLFTQHASHLPLSPPLSSLSPPKISSLTNTTPPHSFLYASPIFPSSVSLFELSSLTLPHLCYLNNSSFISLPPPTFSTARYCIHRRTDKRNSQRKAMLKGYLRFCGY